MPVSHQDWIVTFPAQYTQPRILVARGELDLRRPNKDGTEGRLEGKQLKVSLEALELTAVRVSFELCRYEPQSFGGFVAASQKNSTGACTENRQSLFPRLSESFEETKLLRDTGHDGALAAGNDQPVDVVELVRVADLDRRHAITCERGHVQVKRSLDRENANAKGSVAHATGTCFQHHSVRLHHPRCWSNASSGMSLMSSPSIGESNSSMMRASSSGLSQ